LGAKRLGAFSVTEDTKSKGTESQAAIKQLKRTPSDEILLTELALDDKNITIYDITSVILVGEKESKEPHGQFKCFMDHDEKKFYIEIATAKTLQALTQSAVLNLLSFAENVGAAKIYVCCRKTLGDIRYYLKTFMFIGFQQLSEEEQKEISMTQTHFLLGYDVLEEGEC
jgi:hypothetical protein